MYRYVIQYLIAVSRCRKTYGVYFHCQNECKYLSKILCFLFFPPADFIWRCCKVCRNCLL